MGWKHSGGNRWRLRFATRPAFGLIGLLIVSMVLAACSGGDVSTPTTGASDTVTTKATSPPEDLVFGVDYLGLQFPYIVALKNAVNSEAEASGVKLVEMDAGGDVATQLADMEQLIVQGVDAILFNGLDKTASIPALDAAAKAGIPVILFNTKIDGPYVSWIGSEHVHAGEMQGEFLLRELDASESGKLRVLYILGIPGMPVSVERAEGMKKALEQRASDIEIVERVADFDREKALRVTEEALTANPNFDVIVAQNDDMILGALRAVDAAGLADKIKLIGIDGVPEALEAVADGSLTATLYQDAGGQGRGAVKAALEFLAGKDVEKSISIPFELIDSPEAAQALLPEAKKLYGSSGG